jgi:hypothetical protein
MKLLRIIIVFRLDSYLILLRLDKLKKLFLDNLYAFKAWANLIKLFTHGTVGEIW